LDEPIYYTLLHVPALQVHAQEEELIGVEVTGVLQLLYSQGS